jgi:hypothetical protein
MRLDPLVVQQQISNLLLQVPELAEDDVLRADMIEGCTDLHELFDKLLARYDEVDGWIIGLKAIITEKQDRLRRLMDCKEGLRDLFFKLMQLADQKKMVKPGHTLSIANGQPHVIVTDEAIIPNILCKIVRYPDKVRIKEMLKDGQVVRGAELSNAEPHLTIRTK